MSKLARRIKTPSLGKKANDEGEPEIVSYEELEFAGLLECMDNLDNIGTELLKQYMDANHAGAKGYELEKALESFLSDQESHVIPVATELLEYMRNVTTASKVQRLPKKADARENDILATIESEVSELSLSKDPDFSELAAKLSACIVEWRNAE